MKARVSLNAEGEIAWLRFKQHLAWCNGFALVFIFSDHSEVTEIFRSRLADIYRARVTGLELERPQQPEDLVTSLLPRLVNPGLAEQALGTPLWVDLARQRGDDWDAARSQFLARLNERRERIHTHRNQPIILLFPPFQRHLVREMSPDLWAIRHFALEVGAWVSTTEPDSEPGVIQTKAIDEFPLTEAEQLLMAEWLRIKAQQTRDVILLGGRVSDVCQKKARWQDKMAIDLEVLTLARVLCDDETPETLRDLSISLDNVGGTEQALGEWEAARGRYEESLQIRRQLLARLGETPEALRDLSVSLDNVGGTEQALGEWEAARGRYEESLQISRQLLARLGETPEALRDLSVSLSKVGNIQLTLGEKDAARTAFAEGLALGQALATRLPDVEDYTSLVEHFEAQLLKIND